jgi:hypothetical protein
VAVSATVPLTVAPVEGLEKVSAGAVLSTRVVISGDVVELPATSVAATRRSYSPSAPSVVSHDAGCVLKLPPFGATSYVTVSMPEPPSLVFDVSATVPRTGLPGLTIVAPGAVLSMRRLARTTGEASLLPATSVATVRKS